MEITREKFNTLYTGIALIINGQAPVNATILTDDEMRNIKAMYHYEWVKHTYWTKGYWYDTYRWVGFTVKIPYLYLKWVPGYLWKGWLPIPGHYQPYIAWKRATIKIPIIIWKYQKPKKKTYYTYVKVPDWNDYNNHVTSTKEYFRGFPTPVPDSIEAGDSFKGTLRKNLPGFVIGYELDIGIWMIENHPEDCTLIFFDPTFAWSK